MGASELTTVEGEKEGVGSYSERKGREEVVVVVGSSRVKEEVRKLSFKLVPACPLTNTTLELI